ncbi:hypothetical protein FHS85_003463 [Rhodoligotrophos appendicifer]|uniref:hypothetical protein n=1 Tax=Rhodoligotrophos appendicifer TaxID=987056 RepID=UPI001186F00D|nr:hypothetical protein [Rhodoligotrophos appendicifer]
MWGLIALGLNLLVGLFSGNRSAPQVVAADSMEGNGPVPETASHSHTERGDDDAGTGQDGLWGH